VYLVDRPVEIADMSASYFYLLYILGVAHPAMPAGAVVSSLRSQTLGNSMAGSDTTAENAVESPANAEDQEEESDELVDAGADQTATAGFLPSQAEVRDTAPSNPMASVLQQTSTGRQQQPEQLFHFTSPNQRPGQRLTVPATAVPEAPHLASPLPLVGGSSPVQHQPLPVLELPKAAHGNHTGRVPMPIGLMSTYVSSEESKPKIAWPPPDDASTVCNPPCIQGRGVCNDNVCFCRHPFGGSTCQHKTTGLFRVKKVLVAGACIVCAFIGILSARMVFAFSQRAIETRLERYGKGKAKCETWSAPDAKHTKSGT
jgi:hypothetical protein